MISELDAESEKNLCIHEKKIRRDFFVVSTKPRFHAYPIYSLPPHPILQYMGM